jgi:hypothetical protein
VLLRLTRPTVTMLLVLVTLLMLMWLLVGSIREFVSTAPATSAATTASATAASFTPLLLEILWPALVLLRHVPGLLTDHAGDQLRGTPRGGLIGLDIFRCLRRGLQLRRQWFVFFFVFCVRLRFRVGRLGRLKRLGRFFLLLWSFGRRFYRLAFFASRSRFNRSSLSA